MVSGGGISRVNGFNHLLKKNNAPVMSALVVNRRVFVRWDASLREDYTVNSQYTLNPNPSAPYPFLCSVIGPKPSAFMVSLSILETKSGLRACTMDLAPTEVSLGVQTQLVRI